MSETTIQNETLKKFEGLGSDMYALFCKLDRYKDKMTEHAVKFAGGKLEWLFREEFDRIFASYILERTREKFQNRERENALTPRRWRPWYFLWLKIRENRAAKLIVQEVQNDIVAFFDECEKRLKEITKNELSTPQNPPKREEEKQDHKSDEPPKSPKTGISGRSQARGSTPVANDQSPLAASTTPTKKEKKA